MKFVQLTRFIIIVCLIVSCFYASSNLYAKGETMSKANQNPIEKLLIELEDPSISNEEKEVNIHILENLYQELQLSEPNPDIKAKFDPMLNYLQEKSKEIHKN